VNALLLAGLLAGAPEAGTGWEGAIQIEACPDPAPTLPEQTETALDATLLLRMPDGVGSAVLIAPDGFALTAAHVVAGQTSVSAVSHNGASLDATVVRIDEAADVALLKVDVAGPSACLRPHQGRAAIGGDVFVLGSPGGEELSFSVAKGIISGYRTFAGAQFVQLDASLNPGNSGGPVLNASGSIVAIASWKVSHVAVEGLSFAVPADVAMKILEVEVASQSSPDWAAKAGRRPVAEAPPPEKARPPVDTALMRRREVRRDLIISGAIVLGFGVTLVVPTAAVYYARDEIRPAAWKALQGFNAAGWAMSGVGAALLTAGLVIPKHRRKGRRAKNVAFAPLRGGAAVSGRF
jgi:hypothetical protein